MHYDYCGGCQCSTWPHKKHCRFSPTYTHSAEYADQISRMGDFVSGFGEYELANELWSMAGKMRKLSERELESRQRMRNNK